MAMLILNHTNTAARPAVTPACPGGKALTGLFARGNALAWRCMR